MLQDKKIFITGGAGFIANALLQQYLVSNRVTVYDNFHRDTLTPSGLSTHPNLTIVRGDVLDLPALTQAMAGTDIVIHAAGIAGVDTVMQNPVKTMQVNMLGTANALEAAHLNQVRGRVVNFSTSEVFGSMAFKPTELTQTTAGSAGEARWVYAVSKLAGEHLAHSYFAQHDLPVVNVRPFNVYGPGQTGEGALQVFTKLALRNEPIWINGDGTQIRAWCYVDDFVECLMKCVEEPQAIGQSFNLGNARAIMTTLGLAQTVCRILGSSSSITHRDALSADIELRIPSVEKAEQLLGFKAKIDLEEGIRRTADYFRSL